MSLKPCPDCGRPLSPSARECPNCGRRKPSFDVVRVTGTILILLLFGVWMAGALKAPI